MRFVCNVFLVIHSCLNMKNENSFIGAVARMLGLCTVTLGFVLRRADECFQMLLKNRLISLLAED